MIHLLCLITYASTKLVSASPVPRGVDPANSQAYSAASGQFTCLDGSKTIPFSQVNDDYCDCPGDGSDEPGTSACYYGKFYCPNRGHHPQTISTSFVDDGVCDCCDGSDESKVVCKNVCLEQGAQERQAVRDKVAQMQSSLELKAKLITEGRQRVVSWATRSPTISSEIETAQVELKQLEDEKAQKQAAAEEDKKRIAAEQEAERLKRETEVAEARKLQEEQEQQQQQREGASQDQAENGEHTTGDVPSHKDAAGGEVDHEETDEERGRRIASQWTHDPEAAEPTQHEVEQEIDEDVHFEDGGDSEPVNYDSEDDHYGDEETDINTQDTATDSTPSTPSDAFAAKTDTAATTSEKQPAKKKEKTSWELLVLFMEDQKIAWKREWDDMQAFVKVIQTFSQQVKEWVTDMMEGGMKLRQERQLERELKRRQEKGDALRAQLQAEIDALPQPWKDPEWQAKAREMQEARERGEQPASTATAQESATTAESAASDGVVSGVLKKKKGAKLSGMKRRSLRRKKDVGTQDAAAWPSRADEDQHSTRYSGDSHHHHVWSPLESEVHAVDLKVQEAKRKLQELQDEQVLIAKYHDSGVKIDYGPNDQFASLAGRCVADVGNRWKYEACFFDRASQSEPHNPSNKVNLGTWTGFARGYTQAYFSNGDPCAGAPARSLTVNLVCGHEEKMWGGEEPATCVYTVWMATPLACTEEDLAAEQAKLSELERFEAEIRAEIETAEKARAAAGGATDHTEL